MHRGSSNIVERKTQTHLKQINKFILQQLQYLLTELINKKTLLLTVYYIFTGIQIMNLSVITPYLGQQDFTIDTLKTP